MRGKRVYFEENELYLMSIYDEGSREKTIASIIDVLPDIRDDEEMTALALKTIEKLNQISDVQYEQLDLELYQR